MSRQRCLSLIHSDSPITENRRLQVSQQVSANSTNMTEVPRAESPSELLQFHQSAFSQPEELEPFDNVEESTTIPLMSPDAGHVEEAPAASASSEPLSKSWFISYLLPFFDVDSYDVLSRCGSVLLPLPSHLSERFLKFDLWGPFWIATTLVFTIAVISNFVRYISASDSWSNDFSYVTLAAGLVYSFVSIPPLLLFFLFRYISLDVRWFDVQCVFGYSFFPYILALCLCLVPSDGARWFLLIFSSCLSSCFLWMRYQSVLSQVPTPRRLFSMAWMVFPHILFGLILRILLFAF